MVQAPTRLPEEVPSPGFLAYLRSVPEDAPARLDAFDEIFQRFVDLTATVEAAGESGALSNAAQDPVLTRGAPEYLRADNGPS